MAASTIATIGNILHEYWKPQRVASATLQDNPVMDIIKKDTSFVGDSMALPVTYSGHTGFSATSFTTAQTNNGNSTGAKFLLTTGNTWGTFQLGDKAMDAARNNMGAYIKHEINEIREHLKSFGQKASKQLWGNGGGAIGVTGSYAAGPPITIGFANPEDIVNVSPGDILVASANDGSASAHTLLADVITVVTVNYSAGTFTCTIASASGDLATPGEYLFQQGFFADGGTDLIFGFQAWVPSSAPSPSESFFNVDRSVSDRLSGCRLTAAEAVGTDSEIIERLATKMNARYESSPKLCGVNPEKFLDISRELQNAQNCQPTTKDNYTGTYGHEAIKFRAPYGTVTLVSDKHCPKTSAFLFNEEYMTLYSMGDLIRPMDGDGNSFLRVYNGASYEFRYKMYAQLGLKKPWEFGRAALSA